MDRGGYHTNLNTYKQISAKSIGFEKDLGGFVPHHFVGSEEVYKEIYEKRLNEQRNERSQRQSNAQRLRLERRMTTSKSNNLSLRSSNTNINMKKADSSQQ